MNDPKYIQISIADYNDYVSLKNDFEKRCKQYDRELVFSAHGFVLIMFLALCLVGGVYFITKMLGLA